MAEVFSPESATYGGILDRVVQTSELEAAMAETVTALAALDMPAHGASKLRAREGTLAAIRAAIAADDADFRAVAGPPSTT